MNVKTTSENIIEKPQEAAVNFYNYTTRLADLGIFPQFIIDDFGDAINVNETITVHNA